MKSLFKTTHDPYYVVAPDWTHISAGVRAVHYLCHALNQLGEEAYIAMAKGISDRLMTPRLTQDITDWHVRIQKRSPIVVYPEIVVGNPMQAKKVVRWLLNKPGAIHHQDPQFGPNDQIFYYNKWMLPEGMKGDRLYVACVDPDEMPLPPPERPRHLDCVYGLRYRTTGHEYAPQHQGMLDLSDRMRSREEISAILQQARVLYAYEPSAITTDAIFSGCPAVWVKNPFMPFNPITTDDILIGYGQCATDIGQEPNEDDLADARRTLIYARPQWAIRGIHHTWESIKNFITETQNP